MTTMTVSMTMIRIMVITTTCDDIDKDKVYSVTMIGGDEDSNIITLSITTIAMNTMTKWIT